MKQFTYFYNANILTMDDRNPQTHHMLVSGDTIIHTLPDRAPFGLDWHDTDFARVRESHANLIEFVNLNGATVLPGFCDSHIHLGSCAEALAMADLTKARDEEDAVRILKAHADKIGIKKGQWVRGHGWIHNYWPDAKTPTRHSLDRAFPDNPVYLSSKCMHLGWINTCAIRTCHLTKDIRLDGGSFDIEPGGELSGFVREAATKLVEDLIPELSDEQYKDYILAVQAKAHAGGLTAMSIPDSSPSHTFRLLQELVAEDRLRLRVVYHPPAYLFEHYLVSNVKPGFGNDYLRIGGVKILMDGSLGGRTAYMYEAYDHEPDNFGQTVESLAFTEATIMKANAAGFPTVIHAIGDKTVGMLLRFYIKAAEKYPNMKGHNSIEHLQLIAPKDIPLLKEACPIASVQPVHVCADIVPADRFWGKRARYAYAFRTFLDAGCILAFGSDSPVEPFNPFFSLHAAVNRQSLNDEPEGGWYPEEKITRMEALKGFTTGAAQAGGPIVMQRRGDLSAGKLADFIALDQDPLTVSATQLRHMTPISTWVGGQRMYQKA